MSYQFKYSTADTPTLPLTDIQVDNDFGRNLPEKGKIDTGSFITVLPEYLVKSLALKPRGKVRNVGGFGTKKGQGKDHDAYFVKITIGTIQFELLKVIASDRNNVLLGRDIIHLWKLELDGQNRIGKIEVWSTDPNIVI